MLSLTTVVITATEITQTGYSRIDRPILHPTGCMPWFILHLWGFLWVREARCRGYKITGLPQKILQYYFNIVVTFTLHSWLLQVLFSVIKNYVCRPFFQVILTAALFGKFRFGFQKYFLLLQVSFNISTLAHCTKGNFFSFKAFMTHKLLETRPNGLQGTWNLLSTKFLIHNQRFAENLGLMLTMNQAWYLTKKKSPLTTMRMMTAAVAIAPSVTLCKEWKLVKSMEPRLLDLMHPHLHLWGHLLQCQNCKHLFLSQAYMHQWWGETCWIFQWSIREDQGIHFKSCLIFFNPI